MGRASTHKTAARAKKGPPNKGGSKERGEGYERGGEGEGQGGGDICTVYVEVVEKVGVFRK